MVLLKPYCRCAVITATQVKDSVWSSFKLFKVRERKKDICQQSLNKRSDRDFRQVAFEIESSRKA